MAAGGKCASAVTAAAVRDAVGGEPFAEEAAGEGAAVVGAERQPAGLGGSGLASVALSFCSSSSWLLVCRG